MQGAVTRAEIAGQPAAWRRLLANWPQLAAGLPALPENLVLAGCGTSYYLAEAAALAWRDATGRAAEAWPASEAVLYPGRLPAAGWLVAISRSGETSETVWAVQAARRHRPHLATVALTCAAGSRLAGACGHTLALPWAYDHSVVMTRSFSTMLLALAALTAAARGHDPAAALGRLPDELDRAMPELEQAARQAAGARPAHVVMLGAGPLAGVAREMALKCREMSLLPAVEAYQPLEYRHGPVSAAGPGTLAVLLLSDTGRRHELALAAELAALGVRVLVLGPAPAGDAGGAPPPGWWPVPVGEGVPEALRGALYVVLAQWLGYHLALDRVLNPDAPRHLSQVVRLEEEERP